MVDLITPRESALRAVRDRLEERKVVIIGGTLDGQVVVNLADVDEAFAEPLPAPTDHSAEVRTPSRVVVSAECPKCGLPATIALDVQAELRVDTSGSTLRLKGKSKEATHTCGQTVLFDPSRQESFDLTDIIGLADEAED